MGVATVTVTTGNDTGWDALFGDGPGKELF